MLEQATLKAIVGSRIVPNFALSTNGNGVLTVLLELRSKIGGAP